MEAKVTEHASKRIRERIGVNKKTVERVASIALEKGLKHSDLTGKLLTYANQVYLKEKKANNIRVYADKLFMFSGNVLITVLKLPTGCVKLSRKLLGKKNDSPGV